MTRGRPCTTTTTSACPTTTSRFRGRLGTPNSQGWGSPGVHHGCDWIAFTEHPRDFHADAGVLTSHDLIAAERRRRPDMLIFQGIEWYIPAAEHGTVLVHGKDEAEILRQFELVFDGYLNGWQDTPANSPEQTEQTRKAAAAIAWLGQMKKDGHIDDALVLANHPMRKGIDGPGEIRQWNDADPDIMIGMEGAPGAPTVAGTG